MAKRKIKRVCTPRKVASRRPEIEINESEIEHENRLRHLMIIHRKVAGRSETVYRGSRSDFTRAGVPAVVLDQPASRAAYAFRANNRDAELVRAGDQFELTLHWDAEGPWYHSAEHPALGETARMIRIHAGYWLRDLSLRFDDPQKGLVQTDRLLDYHGDKDYQQPRSRKYRFDRDELRNVEEMLEHVARAILQADICLVEPLIAPKPRRPRAPSPAARAKLAEAAKSDAQVQNLISTAIAKAKRKSAPKPPDIDTAA